MYERKVILAWKDPVYRNSLSEAERSAMPPNPAGTIDLSDEDLGKVSGGIFLPIPSAFCTIGCPTRFWGCPH